MVMVSLGGFHEKKTFFKLKIFSIFCYGFIINACFSHFNEVFDWQSVCGPVGCWLLIYLGLKGMWSFFLFKSNYYCANIQGVQGVSQKVFVSIFLALADIFCFELRLESNIFFALKAQSITVCMYVCAVLVWRQRREFRAKSVSYDPHYIKS